VKDLGSDNEGECTSKELKDYLISKDIKPHLSFPLEENLGSGGGATSFTNQARTCTNIMHVISRLIGLIRLDHGLVH